MQGIRRRIDEFRNRAEDTIEIPKDLIKQLTEAITEADPENESSVVQSLTDVLAHQDFLFLRQHFDKAAFWNEVEKNIASATLEIERKQDQVFAQIEQAGRFFDLANTLAVLIVRRNDMLLPRQFADQHQTFFRVKLQALSGVMNQKIDSQIIWDALEQNLVSLVTIQVNERNKFAKAEQRKKSQTPLSSLLLVEENEKHYARQVLRHLKSMIVQE
ncbi:hypothetical protein LRY65_03005 [Candidatus Woesebacteria bacterium]|nr:hypothetical protein [Candidatus Woesebacteria bacterium]MCD8507373.1 hypothetical protein [Candidatus Woesebacteria bacterium]MCD8527158.1 hypothetical protein [Candidatus Woesebacteria bacterium]MCD8546806.1 hypothetical protein [Candidatus Woesebacteria bacterium]